MRDILHEIKRKCRVEIRKTLYSLIIVGFLEMSSEEILDFKILLKFSAFFLLRIS